ncbi:MAG: Uma2 family endonuclease [Polyangiaceae bacterium]
MSPPLHSPDPETSLEVAPSIEEWRAMSPETQEAFIIRANERLTEMQRAMGEGMEHKTARERADDTLRLHFGKTGRDIYVASDLTVIYPGEDPFSPDLFAVLGVPQPAEDKRLAWVVANEGKGPDFVLEVLDKGSRKKDLDRNVTWFPQLGISEYFVYDIGRRALHGYRLSRGGARKYDRIVPQGGLYPSAVLDMNLSLQDGKLRFLVGLSELIDSPQLIDKLSRMVDMIEAKAEETRAALEAADARAEASLANSRFGLIALLVARGHSVSPELRERVEQCKDVLTLQRWLVNAVTAGSAEEAISD